MIPTNPIDEYVELMQSVDSIYESMINALTETDKSSDGKKAAEIIQKIEGSNAAATIIDLKIELATLLVDITTDDVFHVAEDLAAKGPV
jgi:hypothetical protein